MNNASKKHPPFEQYRFVEKGTRVLKTTYSSTRIKQTCYLSSLEIHTSSSGGHQSERVWVIIIGKHRITNALQDRPAKDSRSASVRYCTVDNIESLSLELDCRGQCVSSESYYPFGGTAIWLMRNRANITHKTRRYSGKERDATGLVYYGFRYYAPWLMRWLNPDPAGTEDGVNLFRMVRNNPLTLLDDNGLMPTQTNGNEPAQAIEMQPVDNSAPPAESPMPERPARITGLQRIALIGATLLSWIPALTVQTLVQWYLTPLIGRYPATVAASSATEIVAGITGACMPRMTGATLGWSTTMRMSFGLYAILGSLGGGTAGRFYRPGTLESNMLATLLPAPAIIAAETTGFSLTAGATYEPAPTSLSEVSERVQSSLPRIGWGSLFRSGANMASTAISNTMSADPPALANLVAGAPLLITAAIPNLLGPAMQAAGYIAATARTVGTSLTKMAAGIANGVRNIGSLGINRLSGLMRFRSENYPLRPINV